MSDLCTGYPHGLGLYCDANGDRLQRTPLSLVSRTYGNDMVHVCLNHCNCADIAPDAPTVVEALNAQFDQCATSSEMEGSASALNDEPATCSRSGTASSAYADACNCDEYWFGRPNNQDCREAMLRLPDYGTTTPKLREFLPIGAHAYHIGAASPPVRTPMINTHGAWPLQHMVSCAFP